VSNVPAAQRDYDGLEFNWHFMDTGGLKHCDLEEFLRASVDIILQFYVIVVNFHTLCVHPDSSIFKLPITTG
jgi:hypothetical protein